jgi:hypothetical protein
MGPRPLLLLSTLMVAGCTARAQEVPRPQTPSPAAVSDPQARRPFFGELHLHTAYSFDAWANFGATVTPDQAYKFARGETVVVDGKPVRRAWPLDFTAVTDHSENMGVLNQLDDRKSPLAMSALGRQILANPIAAFHVLKEGRFDKAALNAAGAMKEAWQREIQAANGNYQPGRFTTFVAYEWSSMKQGKYNLHRNVIFRNDTAPQPFTSMDSDRPEDLWTYLETARTKGFDVIAIPHNANASNGLMFDWNDSDGRPIDQLYAQRRALNEPLTEIAQNKGQSETTPELSPTDEFANFEVFDRLIARPASKSQQHGGYVREAYGRGLIVAAKVGVNPFKLGVVGGTDFHNGLTTSDENAFGGGSIFGIDPKTSLPGKATVQKQLGLTPYRAPIDEDAEVAGRPHAFADQSIQSSGGLTGVWAEENTRDSIFAALKRKETFATSGPRIRVRFFGGWSYPTDLFRRPRWVRTAYSEGVPMGGDLPAAPRGAGAPTFVVQAAKAPDSGNLDRVQVIKIWLDGAAYRERVYDVALSGRRRLDPRTGRAPPVGDTVDLKTATYRNTIGAPSLQTVWRDPDFDPKRPAVYYARVIEIPTPRWTTILAAHYHLPLPKNRPATIRERAWSSPIWYTPPRAVAASRRSVAPRG